METTKKITLATLKRFVRANRERLLIRVTSSFDGMTDGVERVRGAKFAPIESRGSPNNRDTLGIAGLWLVGSSRDRFSHYEDSSYTGIRCYNSCGAWAVAVREEVAQ